MPLTCRTYFTNRLRSEPFGRETAHLKKAYQSKERLAWNCCQFHRAGLGHLVVISEEALTRSQKVLDAET